MSAEGEAAVRETVAFLRGRLPRAGPAVRTLPQPPGNATAAPGTSDYARIAREAAVPLPRASPVGDGTAVRRR